MWSALLETFLRRDASDGPGRRVTVLPCLPVQTGWWMWSPWNQAPALAVVHASGIRTAP